MSRRPGAARPTRPPGADIAVRGQWQAGKMPVRLNPSVAALPRYLPGRAVAGAIKLASNETPYPPLPHVVERITAAASTINRYPDNFATTLTNELAAKFEVAPAQVAVG